MTKHRPGLRSLLRSLRAHWKSLISLSERKMLFWPYLIGTNDCAYCCAHCAQCALTIPPYPLAPKWRARLDAARRGAAHRFIRVDKIPADGARSLACRDSYGSLESFRALRAAREPMWGVPGIAPNPEFLVAGAGGARAAP